MHAPPYHTLETISAVIRKTRKWVLYDIIEKYIRISFAYPDITPSAYADMHKELNCIHATVFISESTYLPPSYLYTIYNKVCTH